MLITQSAHKLEKKNQGPNHRGRCGRRSSGIVIDPKKEKREYSTEREKKKQNKSVKYSTERVTHCQSLWHITIPDRSTLKGGSTVQKIWQVENQHSAQWSEGTKLVFVAGNREVSANEMSDVPLAAPGERVKISVSLKVPSKPGRYMVRYRLKAPGGGFFGPRLQSIFFVKHAKEIVDPYQSQKIKLRTMGFIGRDDLIHSLLIEKKGNVEAVVSALIRTHTD